MINHLSLFFTDAEFPTLAAKYAAFVVWITDAARVGVRHQITFAFGREILIEGATQFAHNPEGPLLSNYPDAAGIRKMIRLLKPASFSAVNPGTPHPSQSYKKARINVNAAPGVEQARPYRHNNGRFSHLSAPRGGRGGYNRKYRPTIPQLPSPNEAFVYTTSTRSAPSTPRATIRGISPEIQLSQPRGSAATSHHQAIATSPITMRSAPTGSRQVHRPDRADVKIRPLDWSLLDE